MTLSPTALEEAAKALAAQNGDDLETVPTNKSHWNAEAGHFGGRFRTVNEPFRSDYEEQATAAITAYLAQAEKEGWVMVRGAGSRHDSYIGLLRSLAECGGTVKLPHPIIRGYGPGCLERHGYAQWLRDSPRTASATGFAITEKGARHDRSSAERG